MKGPGSRTYQQLSEGFPLTTALRKKERKRGKKYRLTFEAQLGGVKFDAHIWRHSGFVSGGEKPGLGLKLDENEVAVVVAEEVIVSWTGL